MAGPFPSVAAFHDWFSAEYGEPATGSGRLTQRSSQSQKKAETRELPLGPAQYRARLPDDASIVLTHGDLRLCNIIMSPNLRANGTPQIAALLDWGQAGWLPSYWEDCKNTLLADRQAVVDPAAIDTNEAESCEEAWQYFTLSAAK